MFQVDQDIDIISKTLQHWNKHGLNAGDKRNQDYVLPFQKQKFRIFDSYCKGILPNDIPCISASQSHLLQPSQPPQIQLFIPKRRKAHTLVHDQNDTETAQEWNSSR
jgi:hypothetical protein